MVKGWVQKISNIYGFTDLFVMMSFYVSNFKKAFLIFENLKNFCYPPLATYIWSELLMAFHFEILIILYQKFSISIYRLVVCGFYIKIEHINFLFTCIHTIQRNFPYMKEIRLKSVGGKWNLKLENFNFPLHVCLPLLRA